MLVNIYEGTRILLKYFDEKYAIEWFTKVKKFQKGAFTTKKSNYWYWHYREAAQVKKEIL